MKTIIIPVIDKIARNPDDEIVCGNSDYYIEFEFDSEWDGYDVKTARFVYGGKKTDVVFEGNTVQVPVMANTTKVFVGVFAGDLRTSTPAVIVCRPSILCKGGSPAAPAPDVYAQIMEMLRGGIEENGGGGGSALPEVTEADNGKILMVVGGKWAIVDFPSGAGGNTSPDAPNTPSESTSTTATYDEATGDISIVRYGEIATAYNEETGELTILHDAAIYSEATGELTI